MLSISDLSKDFSGFLALSDVNLEVAEGARHAVIGPNGAGKSTLFNVVSGYLPPTTGKVVLGGRDITGHAPYRLVRGGLGRSFQRVNIFPELRVFENVQAALLSHHKRFFDLFSLGSRLYREEADEVLNSVGLADDAKRIAGTLAYGKQKQLEIALSLATDPKILLLDEPTAGMSRADTTRTIDLMKHIGETRGITKVVIEHDMHVVFSLADRISVLAQGAVLVEDEPENIKGHPKVREAYLGEAQV